MRLRSLYVVVLVAAVVVLALAGGSTRARAAILTPDLNAVQQWDEVAANTVVKSGAFGNEGLVYMAYVSSAVYDAAKTARQVNLSHEKDGRASINAAVAEAAYRTLVHYFPAPRKAGSPDLDGAYAEALTALPDGPAKQAGIAIGLDASSKLIASRTGDGLVTPIGSTSAFPLKAPGPGVWRLTPPYLVPQTPWVGAIRPFLLGTPDRFLPEPPPELSSQTWVAASNEIKADGSGADPVKKADALFWTANVILQYNQLLRDVATAKALSVRETARLMAMVNVVGADAQIACMNAKYHYLFWRPVTAIDPKSVQPLTPEGVGDHFGPVPGYDDGNPATQEQTGWRPVFNTPNHPEYPAAHGSFTSAEAEVLAQFLGTPDFNLTIHGFDAAGAPGNLDAAKTFASASDLRKEIVNARVWGGVHYRFSGVAGVVLGERVSRYDLNRAFRSLR